MKIGFTIGEVEQHQLELLFDQPSGDLRIMMDGTQVLRDSPTLVRGPVKRYELKIGEREKHKLALQLTFEDEQTRLRELEETDALAFQLSFRDAPSQDEEEQPIAWPYQAIPRVSLMVSAVGD